MIVRQYGRIHQVLDHGPWHILWSCAFLSMTPHPSCRSCWSVGDIWGLSIHILCRTSMSLERNLMFLLPKPTITVGYDWQSFMKMAKWFKHLWNNPFEQTNQWCFSGFSVMCPWFLFTPHSHRSPAKGTDPFGPILKDFSVLGSRKYQRHKNTM